MRKALVFASALLVLAYAVEGKPRRPEVLELPEDLSPQALVHLESWLRRTKRDDGVSPPRRDIFRTIVELDAASPLPFVAPSSPEAIRPQLVGFIFAGGADGEMSPSAAVRYEGRMSLVKEGDSVGPYRVKRMVVGEEIELIAADETIRLLLN